MFNLDGILYILISVHHCCPVLYAGPEKFLIMTVVLLLLSKDLLQNSWDAQSAVKTIIGQVNNKLCSTGGSFINFQLKRYIGFSAFLQ